MDERVAQFRLGVVVLATFFVGTILVLLFVEFPVFLTGTKTIFIHFTDAPGVSSDTPIRKSGVRVGRVKDVKLVDDGVLITALIDADKNIDANEIPRINNSLLGDAVIQFVPADRKAGQALQEGDRIAGDLSPDLMRIVSNLEGKMGQTIMSLGNAGEEVAQLAGNINNMLGPNDDQLTRIVNKTERAMDSFQRLNDSLNDIVGDAQTRADLKAGLSTLPAALRDTQQTLLQMQSAMKLAETNLKNVEGFTKPLGEQGQSIITNMNSGVRQLDRLLTQLADLSATLNSREGSIGQLLNNPRLYQELNEAAENINEVTRDLKPIVADARVFSDKISRHPEVFTRGIIQPSSGIKGVSPVMAPNAPSEPCYP